MHLSIGVFRLVGAFLHIFLFLSPFLSLSHYCFVCFIFLGKKNKRGSKLIGVPVVNKPVNTTLFFFLFGCYRRRFFLLSLFFFLVKQLKDDHFDFLFLFVAPRKQFEKEIKKVTFFFDFLKTIFFFLLIEITKLL